MVLGLVEGEENWSTAASLFLPLGLQHGQMTDVLRILGGRSWTTIKPSRWRITARCKKYGHEWNLHQDGAI